MTDTNNKLRAVLLAALMVMWVFAGSVAFAAGAAADDHERSHDVTADGYDIGTVWQGQEVNITTDGDFSDKSAYDLRVVDGDEYGQAVSEIRKIDDDTLAIDTTGLDAERYALETDQSADFTSGGDATTGDDVTFELRIQTFSTNFASSEVRSGESAQLQIRSNRGNYNATVSADDLDQDDLMSIFDGVAQDVVEENDDDVRVIGLSNRLNADLDFDGIDEGDYELDFEVTDTDAEASASITVTEELDAEISFTQSQFEQERGDVAEISLELEGDVDEFTLHFGDSDAGYESNVTVEPNGEEEVTVSMNTLLAGNATGDAMNEANVFTADGDAEVTGANLAGDEEELENVIEAGLYDISVEDATGDEQDVAVLNLGERSTDSLSVWTVPDGETIDADTDADDLAQMVEDGTLTESETVAMNDYLVLGVEISGVYGADVGAYTGPAATELHIEQLNPRQNRPAKTLENTDDFVTVTDDANNEMFLIVDTDELNMTRDIQADDEFEVELEVTEDYLNQFERDDVDDSETVESEFTLLDREAEFDTDDDLIRVAPEEGEEITGATTVAPGTEMTVRARATGDSPFLKTQDTTVDADRAFSAEFDFSDVAEDTEFVATIRNQEFEDNAATDGIVGEVEEEDDGDALFNVASIDPQRPTLQAGDTLEVTATIENEGEGEGTQTVEFEFDGERIDEQEVTLEGGEETTIEFSQDTADLEEGEYGFGVFSEDTSQSGTLTIEGEEEDEETPEPDDDTPEPDDDTPTPEPEDQVGFGAVLALIAALGAALIAVRRNDL